jgi:pimeloyl-ACP methyl ester carboxylesterase
MLRKLWIPTSHANLLQAQERLLSHHNLTPLYKRTRVDLPSTLSTSLCGYGTNTVLTINAIEYNNPATIRTDTYSKPQSTCLLAHGLGSGLALFYPNLRYLASKFDRVIAIDWLGFGGSSRPFWTSAPDSKKTFESANFFIDSLHEFVQQTNLSSYSNSSDDCNTSKFSFIGHSLGGLLATEYAMKYPEQVKNLYLISPAGFNSSKNNNGALPVEKNSNVPTGLRLLDAAWQNNITPGALVRAMGPKGKENVKKTIQRRFNNRWNEKETELFSDYLYHITAADPSGEYAMNGLLQPLMNPHTKKIGLYPRRPLVERMATTMKEVPVKIAYGDNDWLHSSPECEENVVLLKEMGMEIELEIVKNAGHHVYLDNSTQLHQSMDDFF